MPISYKKLFDLMEQRGVKKNDQTVSYSQSLLGTLDISYEVTGIEAQNKGSRMENIVLI